MQRSQSLLEVNNVDRSMRRKSLSWDSIYNENPVVLQNKRKKKYLKYRDNIIKLILHIFTHITLVALLEPIFFFKYANKVESQIFIDNLVSHFKHGEIFSQEIFENIRNDKILYNALTLYLKKNQESYQNYDSELYYNSIRGFQNKEAINSMIEAHAYQMFYFLVSVLFVLCFFNLIFCKNSYLKIISENFLLIMIIGIYEFWFFTNIILKFSPISDEETNRIITHCTLYSIYQNFPELKHLTKTPPVCY